MELNKYFAQFGEDKILNQIFNKNEGVCVEVGGFDGITGSNTLFFERLGWRCIIVEPMPEFCRKIKAVRNCDIVEVAASDKDGEVDFYVASGVETLSTIEKNDGHFARIKSLSNQEIKKINVKTARLDDILIKLGIDNVDFMTIDVEGHEMSVLSGMDFEVIVPRILIIEDNSNGESSQVRDLMRTFSYVRFKRTGCNDWYINKRDPIVTLSGIASTEASIFFSVIFRRIKSKVKKIIRLK
jgi:FkbM family methyltransferase